MRDYIKFLPVYVSWLPMFESLPAETVKNLLIGSMRYALTGELPTLSETEMPLFYAIQGNIDSSINHAEESHNNAVNAANTRWHGNADACEGMQAHAIEKEIEIENEIERDREIETDMDRDTESEERKRVKERKGVGGKGNPREKENPTLSIEDKRDALLSVMNESDRNLFEMYYGKAEPKAVESLANNLNQRYHLW